MPINTSHTHGKTQGAARITRRFRRRVWWLAAPLFALSGAAFLLATSLNRFFPDTSSTRSALVTTKSAPVASAPGGNATKPLWLQWYEAWRAPQTVANSVASPQKPRVWVDIEALARRHAAWQLANRLEAQTATSSPESGAPRLWTLSVSPFDTRQRDFDQSNANSFWSEFARRSNSSNRRDIGEDRVLDVADFLRSDARANQNASRETSLANAAQRQQSSWFNLLIGDLNRDLSRQRSTRAWEARAVLEEEIEAARTAGLTTPRPTTLSDAEQLELTNLRLKLLPSSRLSDQERAQTRERYLILQSRWDEALRRQEAQYLAEIEEQLQSEPRRLRREGESAISQSQTRLSITDNARLRTLLETQNALLQRDFGNLQPLSRVSIAPKNSAARNSAAQKLAAQNRFAAASPLPQFQAPLSRSPLSRSPLSRSSLSRFSPDEASRVLDLAQFNAMSSNNSASINDRSALGTSRISNMRVSKLRIGELREQARREVRLWSQSVAQREGWKLVSSSEKSPSSVRPRNATEDVWRAWQR